MVSYVDFIIGSSFYLSVVILLNILSVVVTSIILPLLTYAGTRLIAYLNSKIKDENYKILLTTATDIVVNAVRSVFQTYVESLKASGNFDSEAQLIALNKAKDIALEQMTDEVKQFISKNYGSVDAWLTTTIESTINLIKNKK